MEENKELKREKIVKNKLINLLFLTTLSITFIGCYDDQDKKEIVKIRESLDEIKQELLLHQ